MLNLGRNIAVKGLLSSAAVVAVHPCRLTVLLYVLSTCSQSQNNASFSKLCTRIDYYGKTPGFSSDAAQARKNYALKVLLGTQAGGFSPENFAH